MFACHKLINIKVEEELSMIRMQIKIDGLEFEIDQGSHVLFRDGFGDNVYSAWGDLGTETKEEIKNTIIKAENLIRLSANAIWN
jgi:hypothetical protein